MKKQQNYEDLSGEYGKNVINMLKGEKAIPKIKDVLRVIYSQVPKDKLKPN